MIVIVCVLFLLTAAAAVFPDVEVTCLSERSCILPCQKQQAHSMIIWYRNQTPLAWLPNVRNTKKPNNRANLLEQELHNGICSLLIENVMPQDSGMYKCDTVNNKGLFKTSQYYYLHVNVPVKEVVIEESWGFLTCSSKGIYPRPQCEWTSAVLNSTVAQGNQSVLFTTRCITARMHNASDQSCTVSTWHSSHTNTYTQRPVTSVSGTEAVLHCAHTTSPVKTGSWMFNQNQTIVSLSGEVSEGWRPFVRSISDNRSLMLKNLTSHQQGRYTCVTHTDTESYTVVTQLHIRDAPGAPGLSVYSMISVAVTAVLTIFASAAYRHKGSSSSSSNPLHQRASSQTEELDRFHAAWIICGLLGLSSALPCFFVIACLYFQHRLNQNWTMNVLILVNQVTLISEVCKSAFDLRCSAQKHIMSSFAMISVMFVVVLIAMKVPMAEETFFTVSMCALWLVSLLSGMIQGNLGVEVVLLPTAHRRMFSRAKLLSRFVASGSMVLFLILKDTELSYFCHFFFALFISLASLIGYWVLQKLPFAKYHFHRQSQPIEMQNANEPMISQDNAHDATWLENLCAGYVALAPILTYSVFPAITANVHTAYPGEWERFFIPLCCFSVFYFASMFGSNLARISFAQKYFFSVFPIFIVIHAVCIVPFICGQSVTFTFKDVIFTIIIFLFSLLNSFLTELSMAHETNAERHADVHIAKTLWSVIGGIIGAALSFAIQSTI